MSNKNLFRALIGNVLEYYDIALYGYLAISLTPMFFPPTENSKVAVMGSLAAFAAGFVMRPLGGLLFGHFGDRYGRKSAMSFAIMLAAVPTVTIGLLPTYSVIGMWAPITLIMCRLLQGLSVGGECAGATTFLVEHAKRGQAGFMGSLMGTTAHMGVILGTGLGALFTMSIMPGWAWRIPFLLGACTAIMGYYLRRTLSETPEYQAASAKILRVPLLSVLKENKAGLMCAIMMTAVAVVSFQIILIYAKVVFTQDLHLTSAQDLSINTFMMVLFILLTPVAGKLCDKFDLNKFVYFSILVLATVAYPASWLLQDPTIFKVLCFQVVLIIASIGLHGALPVYLTSLFPVRKRYSGIALGHSLGMAICSFTPMILTLLVDRLDEPKVPGFYLALVCIASFVVLRYAQTFIAPSTPDNLKPSSVAAS